MKITCDFPGGNILVRATNGRNAELTVDLRDTQGDWFYWCMDVVFDETGEHTFTFDFPIPVIGPRGPAVSRDNGRTWAFLGFENCTDRSFAYTAAAGEKTRFCVSFQYLQDALEHFLDDVPAIHRSVLCRSNGSRDVELLTLKKGDPPFSILLTSRHHCCEMTATHVLEGILRAAAKDPELLSRAAFYAVPFVDKDGVEAGDQGKNRKPHDHARDYGQAAPLYAETQAITKFLHDVKPVFVLDLHCPWIKGDYNEFMYFVGAKEKRMEPSMDQWGKKLEAELPPEIPYHAADNLRYGTAWNTGTNFAQGTTLKAYAAALDFVRASHTVEIPYANLYECTLDAAKARVIGAAFARVIASELAAIPGQDGSRA